MSNTLPPNVNRGRFLALLVGVFVVLFVGIMMTIGALAPAEGASPWVRGAGGAISWIAAYTIVYGLAKKGKPAWLFPAPPSS